MANVNLKVVFEIIFLTLNNMDIDFLEQELRQKTYTNKETILTIQYVK